MTQGSKDEWFDPAGPDSPTDKPPQPAEDDWLVRSERKPGATTLDLSMLNGARGLAVIGVVVLAVVALVAVVVALGDSAPSSAQVIPMAAAPASTRRVSHTTSTTAPVRSVPVPTTTLKPGDSGPQVKTLQRELQSLGYRVGTIDGSYGSQTSKAVSAFQRARHLTADGIVGPATLLALAP